MFSTKATGHPVDPAVLAEECEALTELLVCRSLLPIFRADMSFTWTLTMVTRLAGMFKVFAMAETKAACELELEAKLDLQHMYDSITLSTAHCHPSADAQVVSLMSGFCTAQIQIGLSTFFSLWQADVTRLHLAMQLLSIICAALH